MKNNALPVARVTLGQREQMARLRRSPAMKPVAPLREACPVDESARPAMRRRLDSGRG